MEQTTQSRSRNEGLAGVSLFEGIRMSESIGNLVQAWSKAKLEMGNVVAYDSRNPHYKNRFASLEATLEKINPVFSRHGISLIQMPLGRELVNLLTHESGEWISCVYIMAPTKDDPQQLGSALTYARRYCAQAIAGISGGEDDDAEINYNRGDSQPKQGQSTSNDFLSDSQPQPSSPRTASPKEVFEKFIGSSNWANEDEYSISLAEQWNNLMSRVNGIKERQELSALLNRHKNNFGGKDEI